jgi:hypothetical protein
LEAAPAVVASLDTKAPALSVPTLTNVPHSTGAAARIVAATTPPLAALHAAFVDLDMSTTALFCAQTSMSAQPIMVGAALFARVQIMLDSPRVALVHLDMLTAVASYAQM